MLKTNIIFLRYGVCLLYPDAPLIYDSHGSRVAIEAVQVVIYTPLLPGIPCHDTRLDLVEDFERKVNVAHLEKFDERCHLLEKRALCPLEHL